MKNLCRHLHNSLKSLQTFNIFTKTVEKKIRLGPDLFFSCRISGRIIRHALPDNRVKSCRMWDIWPNLCGYSAQLYLRYTAYEVTFRNFHVYSHERKFPPYSIPIVYPLVKEAFMGGINANYSTTLTGGGIPWKNLMAPKFYTSPFILLFDRLSTFGG